jgi:hypothetical protein
MRPATACKKGVPSTDLAVIQFSADSFMGQRDFRGIANPTFGCGVRVPDAVLSLEVVGIFSGVPKSISQLQPICHCCEIATVILYQQFRSFPAHAILATSILLICLGTGFKWNS